MRIIGILALTVVSLGIRADLVWHDAATLTIEGRGWSDTEATYDRLPARAKGHVPASVWSLSKHSAGLAIRFQTNASEVQVRWSLTSDALAMPHMAATGVSGVDLYERSAGGRWRFTGNGRPSAREGNVARFTLPAGAMHDLRLYLPLYNGVTKVEIGCPEGSTLRAGQTEDPRSRIVYYGTSIAQGGCASRPGTAHVAILGRMLDRQMVNLGFSGAGKMEPEVAALIAELPASMYVVDCLWNMEEDRIAPRVIELAAAIRKAQPRVPIVFVGQSHMDPTRHPTRSTRLQEQAVAELRRKGFTGIYLLPAAHLIGDDGEGTVDGVHPTDLGMMRQAEALASPLRRTLRAVSAN
jgi:lysophospholipase L1-like esterase